MKVLLTVFSFFLANHGLAQSEAESEILSVSGDMFRWEIEGKLDSLANLFDDKLILVSSSGMARSKTEYLADLKAGKPLHQSVDIQRASASIRDKTAVVWGKGIFVVSVDDHKSTFNLSYLEVFIREGRTWKLMALHASRMAN